MDSPWNRAVGFPAGLQQYMAEQAHNMAAQHRRAVELPSGKVVEFPPPVGSRVCEAECAEIIIRQTVPVGDHRDPRVVGA